MSTFNVKNKCYLPVVLICQVENIFRLSNHCQPFKGATGFVPKEFTIFWRYRTDKVSSNLFSEEIHFFLLFFAKYNFYYMLLFAFYGLYRALKILNPTASDCNFLLTQSRITCFYYHLGIFFISFPINALSAEGGYMTTLQQFIFKCV